MLPLSAEHGPCSPRPSAASADAQTRILPQNATDEQPWRFELPYLVCHAKNFLSKLVKIPKDSFHKDAVLSFILFYTIKMRETHRRFGGGQRYGYMEMYRQKLTTADEAVKVIKSAIGSTTVSAPSIPGIG